MCAPEKKRGKGRERERERERRRAFKLRETPPEYHLSSMQNYSHTCKTLWDNLFLFGVAQMLLHALDNALHNILAGMLHLHIFCFDRSCCSIREKKEK